MKNKFIVSAAAGRPGSWRWISKTQWEILISAFHSHADVTVDVSEKNKDDYKISWNLLRMDLYGATP